LDYAQLRYYDQAGTFFSPDPGGIKTADPSRPSSWNRYTYTEGDPVNFADPQGLYLVDCVWDGGCANIRGNAGNYGGGWGSTGGGGDPCYGDGSGLLSNSACGAPAPPEPEPPEPEPPPPPSCSISLAYSGSPQNQSFAAAGIADAPPNGQLGGYEVAGGWFNAVQYRAIISGDVNPADWQVAQSASESGTLWIQNGRSIKAHNISTSGDDTNTNPNDYYAGPGPFGTETIDWLDNPGQARKTKYGTVVGASLTFSFTATLTNRISGNSCSFSFTSHFALSNPGDHWKMW
jgi:hypothetical protein